MTAGTEILHWLDGSWQNGHGQLFDDVEPAHPTRVLARGAYASADQAGRALAAAQDGQAAWQSTPPGERAAILIRAAALIEEQLAELAHLIAVEQGKPLTPSRQELARAVEMLRYFAHLAYGPLGEVLPSPRPGERILTIRRPVGPSVVVTPWNVPVLIPVWKLAPALMAGNCVVWKPSEQTPLLAQRLTETLVAAGLPSAALQMIITEPVDTERLVADPRVKACSFTGSTAVGQHLVELGARAGTRVLAEMGGNNATIVMGDADLAKVVPQLVSSSMLWSGQRCTATSRVLVQRECHSALLDAFTAAVGGLTVGDPLADGTDLGPVSTRRQFDSMVEWFAAARTRGARVVAGGSAVGDPDDGWYVEPTVVVGAEADHPLCTDEPFGPLAVVAPFDTIDEAIQLADSGPFGLAGSIYTSDLNVCLDAIDRLRVGVLHVNSETTGTEPHAPFGGLAASGTADKELGRGSVDFFLEESTVYVRGS